MPFYGSTRITKFTADLENMALPIFGASITADAPAGVNIDWKPEATAEQIATGENYRDNVFDWHKMRKVSRSALVQVLNGLTQAQLLTLARHVLSRVLIDNAAEATAIAAATGFNLPVEEVDPNP